ncbi:inactive serine protease PAMR1 [Callorhinchus milii]|uniref:inactive serine protease PAMR1 n=1 Tax=Callorhinchus milii TaxID=7868 RepID=UPI001C3FB069|nr:inactive serine protease PAMR1 [Callorhinchus milii]
MVGYSVLALLILHMLRVSELLAAYTVINENCPGAEWNIMCRGCCETERIECGCAGSDQRVGYSVPCCRNQHGECDSCLIHPGCVIFDNCKACHNGSWGTLDDFYVKGLYCSECQPGWSGGDCMRCGAMVNASRGDIILESYPSNSHCEWSLSVNPNFSVELRFAMLSVEFDYLCQYDYIEVRDGDNVDSKILGRFCGNERPPIIRSSGSSLHLLFVSDGYKSFDGFFATFEQVDACASSPCLHDGACVRDGAGRGRCACLAGYTGSRCEHVFRLCDLSVVMCRNPLAPSNGSVEGRDLRFGSVVTYRCARGHRLAGTRTSRCQLDGTWGPRPPRCLPESQSCADPGVPLNGQNQVLATTGRAPWGSSTPGTVLQFTCQHPYVLSGSAQRTCRQNGTWTGSQPTCTEACKQPKVPNLVRQRVLSKQLQTRRTPVHKLYSILQDKVKSPISPTKLPLRSSVVLPKGFYQPHTQLEYECTSALHRRLGSRKRTCLKTGKWSGRTPTCVPICGKLENFSPQKLGAMEWPWQAAIYQRTSWGSDMPLRPPGWMLACSGAMLNQRSVAVAAHCVTELSKTTLVRAADVTVVLGKRPQLGDHPEEESSQQSMGVSAILVHPSYDPVLLDSDIAIIKLSDKGRITDHVQPVCLPSGAQVLATSPGVVMGWHTQGIVPAAGAQPGSGNHSMGVGALQVVDSAQCERSFEEEGVFVSITENMFCGRRQPGGFWAICPPESGGLAVFPAPGSTSSALTWYLAGLVSWGLGKDCRGELLTVYTNVLPFRAWLEKNMK